MVLEEGEVAGEGEELLAWFAAPVLGRLELVSVAALAVDLRQVGGGQQPGVLRAGALGVHAIAPPRLRPEHEPGCRVAHALGPPLLLVIFEEEGSVAGTLLVPLVAGPVFRPVVLVVSRAAAARAPVALPTVRLKYDKLAGRAGPAVADLVTKALAGVLFTREIQVRLAAGVFRAEADSVVPLNEELARLAGAGRVLAVAGPGLLPVHVLVPALAAGPGGLRLVAEHLALPARSLGLYLETLRQGWKVGGHGLVAGTVRGAARVIVRKQRSELARTAGVVLVA